MLTFLFIFLFLGVLSFFWVFVTWVILSFFSIIPVELMIPGISGPKSKTVALEGNKISMLCGSSVAVSADTRVFTASTPGPLDISTTTMHIRTLAREGLVAIAREREEASTNRLPVESLVLAYE